MNDAYHRAKKAARKRNLPWLCACGAPQSDPPNLEECPSCGLPPMALVSILPKLGNLGAVLSTPASEQLQVSVLSGALGKLRELWDILASQPEQIAIGVFQEALREVYRELSFTSSNLAALYRDRDDGD